MFCRRDDFRREFKEANPNNKSVAAVSEVPQSQICKFEINNNNNNLCAKQHQVGKAAGAKWKSMSEEVSLVLHLFKIKLKKVKTLLVVLSTGESALCHQGRDQEE